MDLVYLKYIPNGSLLLVLEFGTRNGKLCGVLSSEVSDKERNDILNAGKILSGFSIDKRIMWLRDHCPSAYRNAYREIKTSNISIISRHPLSK